MSIGQGFRSVRTVVQSIQRDLPANRLTTVLRRRTATKPAACNLRHVLIASAGAARDGTGPVPCRLCLLLVGAGRGDAGGPDQEPGGRAGLAFNTEGHSHHAAQPGGVHGARREEPAPGLTVRGGAHLYHISFLPAWRPPYQGLHEVCTIVDASNEE